MSLFNSYLNGKCGCVAFFPTTTIGDQMAYAFANYTVIKTVDIHNMG